jgi:hypothetical protein
MHEMHSSPWIHGKQQVTRMSAANKAVQVARHSGPPPLVEFRHDGVPVSTTVM